MMCSFYRLLIYRDKSSPYKTDTHIRPKAEKVSAPLSNRKQYHNDTFDDE